MKAAIPPVPPDELIVGCGIGVVDRANIGGEFHRVGHGLVRGLIRAGIVKPHYAILEVGSGLGRLARALAAYLRRGSYVGMDASLPAVEWCRANYGPFPAFSFVHADIFSSEYNKAGRSRAERYHFPFPDDWFDSVFSMSLFTHMQPVAVESYLGEIARVLKRGALTWNSYFLLDQVSDPLAATFHPDRPNVSLPHRIDGGRIAILDNPDALVGLDGARVAAIHGRHNLEITEVRNGPWSGRTDNLQATYQDVIIARKT